MDLQVTRVRNETPSIKAFELAAPDGSVGLRFVNSIYDIRMVNSLETVNSRFSTI